MKSTVTAAGGLNVRTGPGTAFVALPPKLPKGQVVEVLERDPGGSAWVRVARGWVHGDYLAESDTAPNVGGPGWRLATSLEQLLHQVNDMAPKRSKQHDGTIGDPAHAARKSEHNPDEDGVVRALDLTTDSARGFDAMKLVNALVLSRDPRVLYIIHRGRIWRSYAKPGIPAWTSETYRGANQHLSHVHISVVADPQLYDSGRPWAI
jgi:uncharacterized protein YraI